MTEFILRARPGFAPHAVAAHPTSENADILEVDAMGIRNLYPVNPETLRMFKPKMPPSYYHRVEKFGKISLDREMPAGHWATGVAPHIQAIWKTAYDKQGVTFDDIFRALTSEFRIVPINERSRRMVTELVRWMSKPGGPSYLIFVKGKFNVGITPRLDAPLVEHHPGYDPIEWEILDYAQNRGLVSYSELKSYIFSGLNWLTDEDYFMDLIEKLLKAGNLTEVAKNTYRAGQTLEPF